MKGDKKRVAETESEVICANDSSDGDHSQNQKLLAQILQLKQLRQKPAVEKHLRGNRYIEESAWKSPPFSPRVLPSFPKNRFMRQAASN